VLAVIILALLSLAVWGGLYFYQRSVAKKGGRQRSAVPAKSLDVKEGQNERAG